MAAHDTPEYSTADGNDYAMHEQTYLNFLSLAKWVSGFVIIIVVGMATFLT
jgi:Bacterial aa3 type cytochrome c oxidase subunit IV